LLEKSQKSSMEKIEDIQKNLKSIEDISSQNTSKEQNKQNSLSTANLINDNNINNITKKYKHHNKKKKYKNNLDGVYITLGEEDDENINISKNIHNTKEYKEENLEIFSLSSTPEVKKKLRGGANQAQNKYSIEKPKRQYFNKRKYNKHNKSHFLNCNIEEYQSDASGKKEDFIDMSSNLVKNQKNKYESIVSEESEHIEDIKLEKDPNYLLNNTDYIKYDPIKRYYNTDKKIIENIENLNKIEKLLPILEIPRIRPFNPDDTIKIKEKLKNYNISINKTEEKEKYYYKGSFLLYNEKSTVEVFVPCYDDKYIFTKQRCFPKLKKFDEDNDTLTDNEQLDLEIKRGNECLLQFLKKVKEEKDYVKENLSRNNITKHTLSEDGDNIDDIDQNEMEENDILIEE